LPAIAPLPPPPASASSPPPSYVPYVYVRSPPNVGGLVPAYRVLQHGEKCFKLQIGPCTETVSVDRIKPHMGPDAVAPAAPPPSGRPPCA
jgi:hypothetical protein